MTINIKNFYNFAKLLSFNAVFNFVVGGRGLGKTYGAKKKAIKDALRKGDQFIYLRRYKNELQAAKNTFFADIEHEFPQHDFKIMGNLAMAATISTRDDKKRQWTLIGYFIALSTAQNQKSVSFPLVKTIIYDEFIIEKGAVSYLPNEATAFINFYLTVDRYKDKTRVFFLANSVSIMNPYFIEYDVVPDNQEFVHRSDGFIAVHFPENEGFVSDIVKTRFGKFIVDTEYAEYAVGNNFADNTDAMIGLKDSKARYLFSLETKNGTFSVWFNMFNQKYFIQVKRPKDEEIMTLDSSKMDNHKRLIVFSDRELSRLRTKYRQGDVMFDGTPAKNTFAQIFNR